VPARPRNTSAVEPKHITLATYRDSMAALESRYPQKTLVFWTMPPQTTGSDNTLRGAFNQQIRAYCKNNNRPLFDIADIESHTSSGSAVIESGDEGLEMAYFRH